ncbi:osteocrin [Nematolebias whitei]|uniref:osteocrin n=1 Tax=Nematolebias whitei TaxID=451745 RepID=UPI001899A8B6|nr:osteocrin [Nematolebias whitei]
MACVGQQHIDRSMWRSLVALRHHPGEVKAGVALTMKLLRMDDLTKMENNVMELKPKRSFPGNNGPLDRLSSSSMEARQGRKKQSKVAELPRRRDKPPPMDRIGRSRLPTTRG